MDCFQKQNLAGERILVVDDLPTNIEALVETLESERFDVFKATNGKIALKIANKNKPDLILLDVMMPIMDGFETCKKLKENEATRDIPIIFVTARTNRKDIGKGFSLGCSEYIGKPFEVDEVCNRIRTHLLLGIQKKKNVSKQGEDPEDITGLKVLITDDNVSNIDILRKILEPLEVDIYMAPNGKIAVELTPRIRPDLILLDIIMPELNGFEACRILKANKMTKDIPIIFISAKNQPEDIKKGFFMGCVDYVLKPFSHVEVLARIKSQLRLRKLFLLKEIWLKQLQDAKLELEVKVLERTSMLKLAKEEAEKTNKAKSEFISRMSHELRTPTHAILGYSQLMEINLTKGSAASKKSRLANIQSAGQHLLQLINEILNLSEIESGIITISMGKVNVSKILEEKVIPIITPIAEERNISLINQASNRPELSVLTDPLRLTQIMLNLATNAVKYNDHGGSVTIDCKLSSEGRVRITVTDTGQGISHEDLENIFTPFFRMEINDPEVEGTGIGLTITKRLVELLGGKIFVDSVLKEGTSFAIELENAE